MKNGREKILKEGIASQRSMVERVRRSACLLNAAMYDEAIAELGLGDDRLDESLRSYLNDCLSASSLEIESLREKIAQDSENPNLHFQLGVLLMNSGSCEEAELRFSQVVSIESNHPAALIGLALVSLLRNDFGATVSYLQRAQRALPHDARLTLFLARAAKTAHEAEATIDVFAAIAKDGMTST